jgi:hypothetical protein
MNRVALAVSLLALALPAGALAARRMDRATAFRYATAAPFPRGSGVPTTPISQVVVERCKKRSTSAFDCDVTIHYQPAPEQDPNVRTNAPQCEYRVRVAYASSRSRVPTARRVSQVTCPA